MANNLNTVTLSGNLTRDPELRSTGSGKSVVSLRIANNRFNKASFFDVTAWEGLADLIAQVYSRGDLFVFTGEVSSREYTDNAGNNRVAVEFTARDVQLPKKSEDAPAVNDDIDF